MSQVNSDGLLVLRFRDLSVNPGETISKHRRAIAKHGSCWWGWWSRNHEVDPSQLLSSLSYPRPIALYDTDQGLVYRADCLTAKSMSMPFLSPSVDLTPSYYNGRRLKAWFQFSDIESADGEWLIGRTCQYMPLAEADNTGWVVEALTDMRRREATMWLLDAGVTQ